MSGESRTDPVRGARNLADLVRLSALREPEGRALVDGARTVSWRELDSAATFVASGLIRQGLGPGDRVALVIGNSAAFAATYFGVLRAGMVAVPLNTTYTAAELTGLLTSCTPALVVAEHRTAYAVRDALRELGGSQDVPVAVVGDTSYEHLVGLGTRSDAPAPPDPSRFDPETVGVLLFTAGTSGQPKGAMLTHRALLANLGQLLRMDPPPMRADDVTLVVLPLFHVYALNAILGLAAAVGACCVLADTFDPVTTLELVADTGVTNVPGTPPMYVALSQLPDLESRVAGVRMFVSGAAPLAPNLLEQLERRLGQAVWEGYGITEAAPVVATTLVTGRAKPGSVGQPVPGMELELRDDDGQPADEGDPGEIVLRGPNLFSGYWPDGADGPDADGWWHTGDVAYADDDGDLHLVDRRRDLVLVSGFNVYPFEVETVLAGHPDVAEAAVIGVPDEQTGSAVKAFVVPLGGAELDVAELQAHAARRLARFKCPREIVVVSSLPHSASGKVVRARLRDAHA